MQCEDLRDDVLDMLYGEASPDAIARVEEHQRHCPPCRDEMAALRRVRRDLGAWKVPAGLRPAARPAGWPTRRLATAAAVLLALGSMLALGRPLQRMALGFAVPETRRLMAEQATRHQREMEGLRASLERSAAAREAEMMARVEGLLRESEARQNVLVQARLAEFSQAVDAQRQLDLSQVSAGLSYLDGKSGLQAARTAEMMGSLILASQKK